jgi:hypothetical protein
MRLKTYYLPLVLAVTLLGGLLLAACGGGGKEEAEAPAAGETAVATQEAEGGETPSAAEEPTQAGELPAPVDVFADLKSYHYSISMSFEGGDLAEQGVGAVSFSVDGAFVAPDRSQVHVKGDLGGLALEEESITIGSNSWVKSGDTWQEGQGSFDTAELAPNTFFTGLDAEKLSVIKPSEETVNGVDSYRYSIDKADIEQLQALAAIFGGDTTSSDLPENLSLDLWLAKDGGWPVKMVLSASGDTTGGTVDVKMTTDITDVNDPNIKIEPPI